MAARSPSPPVRLALITTALMLCGVLAGAEPPPAPVWDAAGFQRTVLPFLKAHCLECHGATKAKGDFRMDTQLGQNFLDPHARGAWKEVLNVLNGHQMPPEDEPQPTPSDVAAVTDWITGMMVRAEWVLRDGTVVLRRLNRDEYRNTIRDLIGVEYDPVAFPADPSSGGFDNNGRALTVSPLHIELYMDAARQILDRALVEGPRPDAISWTFQPEEGDGDSHRIRLPDGQKPIVHGGRNRKQGGFTVMHHASWDLVPNARDFRVPVEGEYRVTVVAGGRVPDRDAVVSSAEGILRERRDKQNQERPDRAEHNQRQMDDDLEHFRRDRMYGYGPPRLRLIQDLGGQPKVIAEFDVDAPADRPAAYSFPVRCTTETQGLRLEYAYSIPSVLENFWLQGRPEFARPEVWLDSFTLEGPVMEAWPPPAHARLLPESPLRTSDERAYVREVLARFMAQAYRRPVQAAEIDDKLALFDQARTSTGSLVRAIKAPLTAVLASPHFLYLVEPAGAAGDRPRPLDGHELAARLSYFLWSTQPDAELTRLAQDGTLSRREVLAAQVERLLRAPRSHALADHFAAQWLGLREVGANPPAPDLYPQYDRHLEASIIEEGKAFFDEVLRHDLSVLSFIRSDFVVINERLARFYGIPGVKGDAFRRVALPPDVQRGGVATMPAMLTVTSNGTRTSPVKRGVWLMRNLLGIDPGLPVANVGDIKPKVPGIDKATVRQRLAAHRELPQCARCHDRIDPLGFALENFNAAGEWRDQEGFGYKGRVQKNDPKIDASARLPDGTSFTGVRGLMDELLRKEDLFLHALASKLFTYALGREMGIADQPAIKAAVEQAKRDGRTLRALIQAIVQSDAFRTK